MVFAPIAIKTRSPDDFVLFSFVKCNTEGKKHLDSILALEGKNFLP